MGGREYELVQGGHCVAPTAADIESVLASSLMLLPAVEPTTGPFQNQKMRWTGPVPAIGSGQRAVALSFYLAMMTDTCLSLTGATGPTLVEGPFAANQEFRHMLAAATRRPVRPSHAKTGTAIGAALLLSEAANHAQNIVHADAVQTPAWIAYAAKWRRLAALPA